MQLNSIHVKVDGIGEETLTRRVTRVHIFGGVSKGDVGTLAAQRGLCKILKSMCELDVSISMSNKEGSKHHNLGFRGEEVYEPLQLITLNDRMARNYILWLLFNFLNIFLLTFMAMLIQIGVTPSSKAKIINRVRTCNVLINLNLELIKGIPIAISPTLIKRSPIVLVIHKLFWSLRMFYSLYSIFIVKCVFKKRVIVGPGSFGPFKGLPLLTRLIAKFVLSRFVDLLLVREPCSARFLDELGVKNYLVVADAALLDKATSSNISNSLSSKVTIGVAPAIPRYTLTEEEFNNYILAHAKCLDDLVREHGVDVVFLPSTIDDVPVCKMIIDRMNYGDRVKLIITSDIDDYEAWIKRLDLLITTRMHPSIIAARNLIPFCSIIYDHKQIGFLSQIGLRNYSLILNEVSYNNLRSIVDRALNNTLIIKKLLKDNLLKLQRTSMMKFCSVLNAIVKL